MEKKLARCLAENGMSQDATPGRKTRLEQQITRAWPENDIKSHSQRASSIPESSRIAARTGNERDHCIALHVCFSWVRREDHRGGKRRA